jgi:hypothetical protein
MRLRKVTHPLIAGLLLIWTVSIGAGFVRLLGYATTAGERGPLPVVWPANSLVTPDPERANLVILVHPKCPCSHATLGEFEQLMARYPGRMAAHVLFVRPKDVPDGWELTDLWERAAAIPEVSVYCDEGGTVARQFGATTSGHAILFDRKGFRIFEGGLTAMRGHIGLNPGSDAIAALLATGRTNRTDTPVFGCPLFDNRSLEEGKCESCRN